MPKLLMMKGLPASGKTTAAVKLVEQYPVNTWKRVNKDDLRDMLDIGRWSKGAEQLVLKTRDFIIENALRAGQHVVVDDTNLDLKHEARLRELADSVGAEFHINDSFMQVSLDECIARDSARLGGVGAEVIQSMYDRYVSPKIQVEKPVAQNTGKHTAIIVDIDGTLAYHDGLRGHHEYDKVNVDEPIDHIINLVQLLHGEHHILLLSGRKDTCMRLTQGWLAEYDVPYDYLYMREHDDNRKDSIVKREIFEKHIAPHYDIQFVLDDRDQVVRMWRDELHLPCLQVNWGNF